MYVDYVSWSYYCPLDYERSHSPKANLSKVTSPGKLIYVDDGAFPVVNLSYI